MMKSLEIPNRACFSEFVSPSNVVGQGWAQTLHRSVGWLLSARFSELTQDKSHHWNTQYARTVAPHAQDFRCSLWAYICHGQPTLFLATRCHFFSDSSCALMFFLKTLDYNNYIASSLNSTMHHGVRHCRQPWRMLGRRLRVKHKVMESHSCTHFILRKLSLDDNICAHLSQKTTTLNACKLYAMLTHTHHLWFSQVGRTLFCLLCFIDY